MFHLNLHSQNEKTGTMPVSTSHNGTCPNACPFKAKGCYAKTGPLAIHWRAVSEGGRGVDWKSFLSEVAKIPAGSLFRHNQAGDLVGKNDRLNKTALRQLVKAAKDLRGFSYTHYPLTAHNVEALAEANANGFTVNVSTNRLSEVDKAMETGLPVVTVLPVKEYTERTIKTGGGHTVLICPASLGKSITCKDCTLCQKRDRSFAIGFVAHGVSKKSLG